MADPLTDLDGRRVLVWGYGRHGGGAAAARFCHERGASVTILDSKPPEALPGAVEAIQRHRWPWHVGGGDHAVVQEADLVVASPAIPPRAWPAVHPARTSPEGLFFATHRGPRVAVTGTKGKSTTANILATLLGWPVGGNSYEPLLDVLERHGPDSPIVCELSSFQLWYLAAHPPRFTAVVLTSLAVDHLDWHPDLAHYRASKLALMQWSDTRVAAEGLAQDDARPSVWWAGSEFRDDTGVIASRDDLPLPGAHNGRNAALALTVARRLGVARDVLAPRLRTVRGLPHRLETVPGTGPWAYINDSIATTPESAMAALEAIPGPLAVILGGSDKGASFEHLAAAVATRRATAVVIGSTAARLAEVLRQHGVQPLIAGSLQLAVMSARVALGNGGTILLSPACASFDQFLGFEDRGEQFRRAAQRS